MKNKFKIFWINEETGILEYVIKELHADTEEDALKKSRDYYKIKIERVELLKQHTNSETVHKASLEVSDE